MKKTVLVTIEKEIEIELAPEVLTQEFLTEFESYMFQLRGDDLEERQESLFKYAAKQIAEYEGCFIEGLGKPVNYLYGSPGAVGYKKLEHWIDAEVVE